LPIVGRHFSDQDLRDPYLVLQGQCVHGQKTNRNKSGPERLPAQKEKSSVISMGGVKLLIPFVQEITCAQNSRVPRANDVVNGSVAGTRLARISECEGDGVASYPVIETCT
jgi:hypothetical protein